MEANDPLLIAELRRDEGVRYEPYFDVVGVKTVGVGHNLKAKPLGLPYPIDDEMVDRILLLDIADVFEELAAVDPSTTAFIRKSAWTECERVRVEGSAAVVGEMMLPVLEPYSPDAKGPARALVWRSSSPTSCATSPRTSTAGGSTCPRRTSRVTAPTPGSGPSRPSGEP